MNTKELTTDYTELHGFLWSFAPNPLKGAYTQYVFNPPPAGGGMGGEFIGVLIKNLIKICNYNVITYFKLRVNPCNPWLKNM